MKKEIFYDKNALKELREFKKEIEREFQAYIAILASEGGSNFPKQEK